MELHLEAPSSNRFIKLLARIKFEPFEGHGVCVYVCGDVRASRMSCLSIICQPEINCANSRVDIIVVDAVVVAIHIRIAL